MSHATDRYDNHSRQSLPDSERASAHSIALITFGIGTTLPVFWLGADVTQAIGTMKALWVFLAVCGTLGLMSVATGIVGSRSRLSTYMVLHFSFGRHGAKLLNVLIAVTLVGFYAATIDAFGQAASSSLGHYFDAGVGPGARLCALTGSVLMTVAALVGMRGLERLSVFSVPLMAIFILYTLRLALEAGAPGQFVAYAGHGGNLVTAISNTIGMVVMMPVLMPDVTRYAHGVRGCLAASLGIALGFPLVFMAGGLPSILTAQNGIAENLAHFGVVLPALFILLFSNWITNTANLYSATLTLATVSRLSDWKLTLGASAAGTALALAGFMQYFEQFVFGLSVFIPPIASIYLVDFFLLRGQRYDDAQIDALPAWRWTALLSWALACAVAWLGSYRGWQFSSIPTVDALLTAAIVYPLLHRCTRGRPDSSAASTFSE
jgi:cytosine permease